MSSRPSMLLSVVASLLVLPASLLSAQSTLLNFEGAYHGAEFGTVVAYGADYDGDGKGDLLVGCPEDDTNGEDAGAVYLCSGVDGSLIRSHFGSAAGDRFGTAVVVTYDADGDGWSEYGVGAPFADVNGTDSGRVRFYSAQDGHLVATLDGPAAGDRFGSALANVGKFYSFDGDTTADVLVAIGAPYADGPLGTDVGAVFFRTPLGGTLLPPFERRGIQAFEHCGAALDAAGHSLVIGAPDYDAAAGSNAGRYEVWDVYTQLWLSSVPLDYKWSFPGTAPGGRLGTSVAVVEWPDPAVFLNADEYAAGAPSAAIPYVDISNRHGGLPHHLATLTGSGGFGASIASVQPGYVKGFVVIGAPDLVVGGVPRGRASFYQNGAVHHVIDGVGVGERFGAAVASGVSDTFVIGAPLADGTVPDAGRIEVENIYYHVFSADAPVGDGDRAGGAVAGLGDINGDGVPDLLVGSPDADSSISFPFTIERIDCGAARVLSGATGAVLRSHFGGQDGDHLGASVAALGDINLDGVTDYVIGAPQNDNTTTTAGYAIAVSGLTGTTLFTFTGFFNSGEFGAAVGGGSDLNGDGRFDILVGSPGTSAGNVTAYSGVNGAMLGAVNGATAGDRFGAAVAGLGADLDGDGKQEYVVGAPGFDFLGSVDAGRAYVLKSVNSLTTVTVANGTAANDHTGAAVAAAGDINKDGVADYIVGVPGYDTPFSGAGRVRVFSGAAGLSVQLASVNGNGLSDAFGTSVAGLGDVNNDGWPDWAAGAPDTSLLLFGGGGYVKVVSGKDQSVLFTLAGAAGDGLGSAIAAAGDVNLDGMRDIVVGAPLNDAKGVHSGYAKVISLSSGLPVWTNLGFALPGTLGAPQLVGAGSLLSGSPGALTLSGAKPSSPAYLFVALTNAAAPFKGGTLVPVPPLLTLGLLTSGAGDLPLAWAAWPAGLSGLDLFFQYAIQDPAAVAGVALSNALRADVP